jgi:hypothetical protein
MRGVSKKKMCRQIEKVHSVTNTGKNIERKLDMKWENVVTKVKKAGG